MKERPILFSGQMIRAILGGRKTQTRRVLTPEPHLGNPSGFDGGYLRGRDPGKQPMEWRGYRWYFRDSVSPGMLRRCPFGVPGDRLWVKETWGIRDCGARVPLSEATWPEGFPKHRLQYEADSKIDFGKRPSIHMPRWASRLTLEVLNVRVERLQEISAEDCEAEGVIDWSLPDDEFQQFAKLWDSINGKKPGASWESNPWVWVIEFKQIEESEE